MKRIVPFITLIMLAAGAAFATPGFDGPRPCGPGVMPGYFPGMKPADAGPYLASEIEQISRDQGSEKLGDMDMNGLLALRDRLSVAAQKDDYVRRMGVHSFVLPGLGQLETGHTGEGIGFMTADIAVLAGTIVTAYYMLPSDLRLDRLDYFNSDINTINTAWGSHTVIDYLPAALTMLAGMTLDQTLRHWSAAAARRDARGAVDSGAVKFTPKVGLGVLGFQISY